MQLFWTLIDRINLTWLFKVVASMFILAVSYFILAQYGNYLPPNFSVGFLVLHADRFSPVYAVGFYAHILAAPVALFCGMFQFSKRLRVKLTTAHRFLGKIYAVCVLGFVAPGGAIMSIQAYGGPVSKVGFFFLSVLTWFFTLAGWRTAKQHRFTEHADWMVRSYLLLCSAVLLRCFGEAATRLELEPEKAYIVSSWLTWVPSLIAFEWIRRRRNKN